MNPQYYKYDTELNKMSFSDPYQYYGISTNRKTKRCINCDIICGNFNGRTSHERTCLSRKMRKEMDVLLGKMQKILLKKARDDMNNE